MAIETAIKFDPTNPNYRAAQEHVKSKLSPQ